MDTERETSTNFNGRALIDGVFAEGDYQHSIDLVDPASEAVTATLPVSGTDVVDAAVRSARAAFDDGRWHTSPPPFRKAVLMRWADLIEAHAGELATCDRLDMGKPVSPGTFEAAMIAAGFVRFYGEAIDKSYPGRTVPTFPGSFEMQVRRPRGVVGAIIPWNFPVINAMMKLSQILAAGNTVVVKPSELSPRSAERLVQLALEAGMPPGVLNLVQGGGSTGTALASHPGVDLVSFTGSTRTGKALMQAVGSSSLKPLILECGGKSPELVFADIPSSDRDAVAQSIIQSAMMNTGQLCVARTRLYIQDKAYDDMLGRLVDAARKLKPGSPADPATAMGPVASRKQLDVIESYIASGVEEGGTIVLDGRIRNTSPGCFVGPTLFTDLSPGARIMQEEVFGPVLCISRFKSDIDAVREANNSAYGLAATIWTTDLRRAHTLPAALNAGMVKVLATPAPNPVAGFAHAGEPGKQSGFGIEGGMMALESYSRLQAVEMVFDGAPPPPGMNA